MYETYPVINHDARFTILPILVITDRKSLPINIDSHKLLPPKPSKGNVWFVVIVNRKQWKPNILLLTIFSRAVLSNIC